MLCSLTDDEGDENGRMKELGNRLTQLLYVHLRTCNMRLKRLAHDVQKVGAVLSGTYSSTAPTQSPTSHPTLVHHSHCNADPACSAAEFVSMTSIQHRYSLTLHIIIHVSTLHAMARWRELGPLGFL